MDLGQINVAEIVISVIGFLIVYTLNGIKQEIVNVKETVGTLSESLINLDKRVIVLETKQNIAAQGQTNGHHHSQ